MVCETKQVIKDLMIKENMTQTKMAKMMGISLQNLNEKLVGRAPDDMKTGRFVFMLNCLGYDMKIKKTDCRRCVPKYLEMVEEDGKFWAQGANTYTGLKVSGGEKEYRQFETKDECISWLNGGE